METLPLIAMFTLFLAGGERSALADRGAQAISNGGQPAAAIILCLGDEFSSADGVAAGAAGMLGEEEDPDDRSLFDTDHSGVISLVVPNSMVAHADAQPRNCAANSCPIPLRC